MYYGWIEDYNQGNQESSMVLKESTKRAHGIYTKQLLQKRQPEFFTSKCGWDHEDCDRGKKPSAIIKIGWVFRLGSRRRRWKEEEVNEEDVEEEDEYEKRVKEVHASGEFNVI